MRLLKFGAIALGSLGLLFFGAFSQSDRATSYANNSNIKVAKTVVTKTELVEKASASKNQKGGQVVEAGAYHLELVPEKGEKGTHLDLYLQRGDNHEAIPNAKVTAQVQSPDGTQKNLNFKYDPSGKHYTTLLPGKATGQYQMKVTADVKGEKVNGRFSFKQ
ncbi:MAG: hypothetical protein CLLPBCKN_007434 [Chroococcidiopsis cubana SAG 39.79]|uniref:YtkA-like domain-containing protein n=1 Tax=Chroococcidiopsis cubana SAG 39.79 TaxID=388085 RepID=A0AB37US92_9CYAN|nr:hypothetical protein [Chroococcidiopsis cubana]MDZ4877999.1 hypothetical protein [Chroococcidiopsis cubana SAG 39.79]PSB61764.1 hypothetical protein C7B79_20725 [Chroococcidiopsis cubana CCALA 043]RUT14205.1 hypothetical protein DSM107010_06880 [Chroococcidiopsis cubana SAG 39.79]